MDNNVIVLGHLHKDFTKFDFIVFLVGSIFLLSFSIFLSLYFKILGVYIASLVLAIFSIAIMTADIHAYKRSKLLCENVIAYDDSKKVFIINIYGKQIVVQLAEIKAVKYKNKSLEILEPIILYVKKNEGCIIFILNDGKKIKTLKVKEVVETYNQINKRLIQKS